MMRIGPYEISRELGQGALAIVHEAFDPKLKRKVALKVLHPIFSRNKQNIERLRHEAQTLAQLHHPNIINIYEFLDEEEAKGIVTEYVEGQTLAEFLDMYPVILPEIACVITAEILAALEHAHSKKIIHRDIKPQNIIVNAEGQIKLADFSIAKIMDKECLTLTGQLIGSPFFMSPEQAMGDSVDERSDIFTVGILLYRLVTGELPFFDNDQSVVLKKILDVRFKKPSQHISKVSDSLDAIILKALQKDKTQRFQKAWEFRYELLKYLQNQKLSFEDIRLSDFFKNPKAYEMSLIQGLSQELMEKGRLALKERDFQKASELWNRVLEYDPENASVLAELNKMSSGKRRKKVVRVGTFVAIGGLVAIMYIRIFKVEIQPVPDPTAVSIIEARRDSSSPESEKKKSPIAPTVWAFLKINMDPDTHCYIDGEYVVLDETHLVRLKPGAHRIKFKKGGFKNIQAVIKLKKGETSVINIAKGS